MGEVIELSVSQRMACAIRGGDILTEALGKAI
jgi:hypothetical protein